MLNIFIVDSLTVSNPEVEEKKLGKASNIDELMKLLECNIKWIKKIYDHEAYKDLEKFMSDITKNKYECTETQLIDIKGISVNVISNGYKAHTIVFYL